MNDTYRSQFRLPSDLADKLRAAAEKSNRSMNAEIVARLERSFAEAVPDEQVTAAVLREELRKLQERIGSAIERASRPG